MLMLFKRLFRDQGGQDLAEYGIALIILALGMVIAVHTMYSNLQTIWGDIENSVSDAAD